MRQAMENIRVQLDLYDTESIPRVKENLRDFYRFHYIS